MVIVAGGEEPDQEFLRKHLQGEFWCAERGYLLARSIGRRPTLLIGDLDSLSDGHISELEEAGCEILRFPPEKDESDLELALYEARRRGHQQITFLGMSGGRLDHALFNLLAVLGQAHDLGIAAEALSSDCQVRLLGPGEHKFRAHPGALCSLLPLTPTVKRVELGGLRYPLHGEDLQGCTARTLSNVVIEPEVRIRFQEGRLLVLLPQPN
jgi:thiamine pyrophosphokinase